MSADYYLQVDTGNGHSVEVAAFNVTYNLGVMLRAAGFPAWRALSGAPPVETAGVLDGVARALRADPDRFKAMNPPNGWGDYDVAVKFVEDFRDALRDHPNVRIEAWL